MNKKVDSKVESVRRFFADSKASNHPINEHPVSKAEEYVRNLYFDMLCVVAQYECNDTENAFTLIKRIMATCTETQPLAEYIKRSMEITPDRTAEFIKQCKDKGLCEIFMIDAMLLSCSNGSPNIKQAAFIAQFGDMLGFDKSNMEEMVKFSVAILEQDSDKYQELLNGNNENVQETLLCYAKKFVFGLILCTNTKRYYFAPKLNNIPFNKKIEISNIDDIFIENLEFMNNIISVSFAKKITIINCLFHDYCEKSSFRGYNRKNAIIAHNVQKISIEKSNFKNCICEGSGTAIIHNSYVQNLCISDCKFNNIRNPVGYHDSCTSGGVIYFGSDRGWNVGEKPVITIKNSEFINCSVGGHDCGAIIYKNGYPEVNIHDSNFYDCRGSYLFADYSFNLKTDQNNQYINCCTKKKG